MIIDLVVGVIVFLIGYKFYNSVIGVDKDMIVWEMIFEMVVVWGQVIGVIVIFFIIYVMFVFFFVYVVNCGMVDEIVVQLFVVFVDFFVGGGIEFFVCCKDGKNYLDFFVVYGYLMDIIVFIKFVVWDYSKKYGYFLVFDGMLKMLEGWGDFLFEVIVMVIDFFFEDKDGFFLMVEGF